MNVRRKITGQRIAIACELFALAFFFQASQTSAAVIYVKSDATGANTGASWTNACADLQSALAAVQPNDEIWVAAGTYKPTAGTDRTISFVMKPSVTIYGGFAGTESARDQRDWTKNESVLSGDIGVPGDSADNSIHVLIGAASAMLDGITIANGNARGSGTSAGDQGGGMLNDSVAPVVANCRFVANAALNGGGGMYNRSALPVIVGCVFANNVSDDVAGGVYGGKASGCAFLGNSAQSDGGGSADCDLTSCTFTANLSGGRGGGSYGFYPHTQVRYCIFNGNAAVADGGGYFGDYAEHSSFIDNTAFNGGGSTANCYYCLFSGNRATASGGGQYSNGPASDCTFVGNSAGANGGGKANGSAFRSVFASNVAGGSGGGFDIHSTFIFDMTDCAFVGNRAVRGGGASVGDLALANCTFWRNTASQAGGGFACTSASLKNCIFYGDAAPSGPEILQSAGVPVIQYCDIQGSGGSANWVATTGVDAGGNIDADPQFADPDDPAGPDGDLRTQDDGLQIKPGSPCIDAGNPTDPPAYGFDILYHPQKHLRDIGAYENQVAVVVYVNSDAAGANNGKSWSDAYVDLQSALSPVFANDEIWVAAGTYKPTAGTDRRQSFNLTTRPSLYGGFAGTETERAQRDWTANSTILSGDIGEPGIATDNSDSVVNISSDATLDGFTLSDSGGAYGEICSPAIANCTFSNNSTSGLYCSRCRINLTDCLFKDNIAGIYLGSFGPYFYQKFGGGGAYFYQCLGVVSGCSFVGNSGGSFGGGAVLNNDSSVAFIDCVFSGNTGGANGGGAIYNLKNYYNSLGFRLSIFDCSFDHNTGASAEGGVTGPGGAIRNFYNSPDISNCVFTNNTSGRGGGGAIDNYAASPAITNCTFANNTVPAGYGNGGALSSFGGAGGIANCILWGNRADIGPQSFISSAFLTRNCDIQGSGGSGAGWNPDLGTDSGGNIDADPKFADAANPAGPDGLWRTADDGLRLLSDSPCINTGLAAGVPNSDILGASRVNAPDIGAYEFQYAYNAAKDWALYR